MQNFYARQISVSQIQNSSIKNKIKVLEWPRKSQDLIPIKNLWDTLKDKVTNKEPPSDEHSLRVIKESW